MSGALSMYDGLEQGTTSNNGPLETGEGAPKKLSRGISRATENDALVNKTRSQLAADGLEAPEFTFSLPDLSVYPGNFIPIIIFPFCLDKIYLLFLINLVKVKY